MDINEAPIYQSCYVLICSKICEFPKWTYENLRNFQNCRVPNSVHRCYAHVCFVQVTTCGAPEALTCLGACTFLLLSHLLGSQNKYQQESARTEACIGSAKQCSKLSLGQNKPGPNICNFFTGNEIQRQNIIFMLLTFSFSKLLKYIHYKE